MELDLNKSDTYKYLEDKCIEAYNKSHSMYLDEELIIEHIRKNLQEVVGTNIIVHIAVTNDYIFTFVDRSTLKILVLKLNLKI